MNHLQEDIKIEKSNNLINQLKENRKLLEIQQKLEKGLLKEKELTEEVKTELVKLYKKQIRDLQIELEMNNKELQSYKETVVFLRKNIRK